MQEVLEVDVAVVDGDNTSFTAEVTYKSPQDEAQPWRVDWGDGSAYEKIAAGTTTATHTYTAIGPFDIVVMGDDLSSPPARVFAGDIPAFDPSKYKKTALDVIVNERAKAAKIFGTTGILNG